MIVGSFINIGVVLKGSKPAGENPDPVVYAAAKSLLLSLTVISICVFFLSVAYDFTIYVWVGLTICLRRVYEERKAVAIPDKSDLESAPVPTPAFAPTYNNIVDRSTTPPSPPVSGKRVRFNRFR